MRGAALASVRGLPAVGVAAAVAFLALVFAVAIAIQPFVAIVVPAVLLTAVLCARRPAAAVAGVLILSGSFGSLQAFNVLNPGPLVDLLLAGLWVSVLVTHAMKRRTTPWLIGPGLALVCLYIAITFFEIPTAASLTIGAKSFRYSAWYMLALPLIALAGWSLRTYVRISRAYLVIALLVGAYAVLRLIIGPAVSEREFALQGNGTFNVVDDNLALIGSFPARHSLAFWAAVATPFCLAAALTQRGRWRVVALLATGLCVTSVLGTQVRAALPALVVGAATVIVLHQVARGLTARTLAHTVAGTVVGLTVAAVLFSMVVGEDSSRYSAIFSPSGDTSYEHRIAKWDQAIEDISHDPFGKGLGTAGLVQELGQGPYLTQGSYGIDSSYLKIAYEQGFPILIFFVIAMLALLFSLVSRITTVRDEMVRGIAIGGAGTLVAALAMFVTAIYVENLPVLMVWAAVGTGLGAIAAVRAKETEAEMRAPAVSVPRPPVEVPPAARQPA